MITIADAQVYSVQRKALAYEITYSDGTKVRALVTPDNIIRKEYKDGDVWKMPGKEYVVDYSKRRAAEAIKDSVLEFLGK